MAPQRDADVDLLADGAVVGDQRLVLRAEEVQHRRVHDDEVGADRLRMLGKLDDGVRFWSEQDRIVRAPPISSTAISNVRLRSASDIEKNSPCLPETNTPSTPRSSTQCRRLRRSAGFVDREIGLERRLRRRPDAAQMLAGIGLGVVAGIFHRPPFWLALSCRFLAACHSAPECRRKAHGDTRFPLCADPRTAICISAMRCPRC